MRSFIRRSQLLLIACLLPLGLAFAADGEMATAKPSDEVMAVVNRVIQTVIDQRGKIPEEQLDGNLRSEILKIFDFDEMSKLSLAANYHTASPEELKQFVDLFGDLLATTYLKRIKRNAENSKVVLVGESVTGTKGVVKTKAVSDGDDLTVDYRVFQVNGHWRIYDVVIENVGLVSNYRNEFSSIIRKDGFKGLIGKLKDKQVPVVVPPKLDN